MFFLKERLIEWRCGKKLLENRGLRNSVSWAKAQSVGVLLTVNDERKVLEAKRFRDQLRKHGKEVYLLGYFADSDQCPIDDFDIVTPGDFNWKGAPEHKMLRDFLDMNLDFLFHLDREQDAVMGYLCAANKAKCRVGVHQAGLEDYYELMVAGSGKEDLLKEMLHYIHVLEDYA